MDKPYLYRGKAYKADERGVLGVLSENRVLTRAEIGEATGYNKAKLLRVIPRLLEKNVIAKVGTGRSTKYTGV